MTVLTEMKLESARRDESQNVPFTIVWSAVISFGRLFEPEPKCVALYVCPLFFLNKVQSCTPPLKGQNILSHDSLKTFGLVVVFAVSVAWKLNNN